MPTLRDIKMPEMFYYYGEEGIHRCRKKDSIKQIQYLKPFPPPLTSPPPSPSSFIEEALVHLYFHVVNLYILLSLDNFYFEVKKVIVIGRQAYTRGQRASYNNGCIFVPYRIKKLGYYQHEFHSLHENFEVAPQITHWCVCLCV